MTEAFLDWKKKTVTFYRKTTTVDANGVPSDTAVVIASGVKIGFWVDRAIESNLNDRFVGEAIGRAMLGQDMGLTTEDWFEIDGVKHFITGVNDVGGFGEVIIVSWRRGHGS